VLVYEIRDRDNTIRAFHTRMDSPSGKRMGWRRPDGTSGLNGTPTAELPLYGAQQLAGWAGRPVVVTEGEKAAQSLVDRGVPALGTVTGAGVTPCDAVLADLLGLDVALWPDNDEAGMTQMARIAERLVGVAATVRVVTWPEAPEKGDAADYAGDPWDLIDAAAEVEPDPPAKSTGRQTLFDLPHGPAPDQLVDPFLTPEGVTILYGPGGVGKGMLSVYFSLLLVRAGRRVMVVDFESHAGEWGRRARAMGYTDDELRSVHYRAPFGDAWTAKRGSLLRVADLLRADCDALGVDYLIVDSYTTATSTGDSMGGAPAAQEFYNGIARIGRPAAVIAHVAGGQGKWPDKPFGSIFVHNLARETWAVEQTNEDDDELFDPSVAGIVPQVMALELRNKKLNVGRRPRPQFLTFSFQIDGTIDVDHQRPQTTKNVRELIEDVLRQASKPMSSANIAKAIAADTGQIVNADTLARKLRQHFLRSDDAPFVWSIK
jgi:hypothetical protein